MSSRLECGRVKLVVWPVSSIKSRSRVEKLPPSSHVKEPSVKAHDEHYAHDEWSIGDLSHWLNYPFLPITVPVSSPVAFKFLNVLVLNIAEKLLAGH